MKRFANIILGAAIAAHCVACWLILEIRNNAVSQGVLQQYHLEYADGGSKKWRFGAFDTNDPRRPLHDFIKRFGLLVYPVAIGGIVFFGLRLFSREQFAFSLAVFAVCLIILARFIMLGVLTAALEI